jgi:hypothetical protein
MAEMRSKGLILRCYTKNLLMTMGQTWGSDERTIKNWTRFLVDNGYIKFVTYRTLNMV